MNSVIDEIIQEMLKVLDNSQLMQLKQVLRENFGNNADSDLKKVMSLTLQIIYPPSRLKDVLKKTINYYHAALKMMLMCLGKHVQKISTEDLR